VHGFEEEHARMWGKTAAPRWRHRQAVVRLLAMISKNMNQTLEIDIWGDELAIGIEGSSVERYAEAMCALRYVNRYDQTETGKRG
jgi:hypothetical protein